MLKSTDRFLIHHAIPSGQRLIGNGFVCQHDNDPKHTANAVKSYLERKTADKTRTSLHRETPQRQLKCKEELWVVLKEEAWYDIPEDYFRKPQDSLPKRVQDVFSAKGGHKCCAHISCIFCFIS